MRTEIVASLEGMKVIVRPKQCELYEYDFAENVWRKLEQRAWLLPRAVAEGWLTGWNDVDHFQALNLLTAPILI